MENLTAIIIVGIYTIAYVVVFFIQKSQIDKLKTLNNQISAIMPFFDIDKINRISSLNKEIAEMQIKKMMLKFEVDEEFVKDFLKPHIKKFEEIMEKQINEEMAELILFASTVIANSDRKIRNIIVEKHLPKTSTYFEHLLEVGKKDS